MRVLIFLKGLPSIALSDQRSRAFHTFRTKTLAIMPDAVAVYAVPKGTADQRLKQV